MQESWRALEFEDLARYLPAINNDPSPPYDVGSVKLSSLLKAQVWITMIIPRMPSWRAQQRAEEHLWALVGTVAELCQELPVVFEIDAKLDRDAEDGLSLQDGKTTLLRAFCVIPPLTEGIADGSPTSAYPPPSSTSNNTSRDSSFPSCDSHALNRYTPGVVVAGTVRMNSAEWTPAAQ